MNSRSSVLALIRESMDARGWPRLKISDLPEAFARDTLVTPYFRCSNLPRRPFGKYIVEGTIGVVHQGFEKKWTEDPCREPRSPGFGAGLHIANFRELGEKLYISCDGPIDAEVDAFCKAVNAILAELPSDEQQLVAAFEKGELYRLSIEKFAGYSHRRKFQQFTEFVRHLRTDCNTGGDRPE